MSGKMLFACSKCFTRHKFEELSSGQQLCKNCRGSSTIVKCAYCRSEFQQASKSQNACKKCEHNLNKYGKPKPCECCKIVAAFGSSKCMRCAGYEAKYGPPVQCEECKQRSAFDKHDENKKVNGKLLCWLCTCSFRRAILKAQQDGRLPAAKKRPHEKSHRESASSSSSSKKPSRSTTDMSGNSGGLDIPEKISRTGSTNSSSNAGNGTTIGLGSIAAPVVVSIDPNSADHVVAITNLKERIASLEKRLQMKDKELLEKDKQLTELKSKHFEKEIEMRNKLKEVDRLHEMKVEIMNRKVAGLLKEVAALKKNKTVNKKGGGGGAGGGGIGSGGGGGNSNISSNLNSNKEKEDKKRSQSISPIEETTQDSEKDSKNDNGDDKSNDDDRDDKNSSIGSRSNSPSTN